LIPGDLRSRACEIKIPPGRSYRQILYHRRIQEFLLRKRVDIYHLPNTLPFVSKIVPTVVSIHDLADLRLRKYGWFRTKYRWLVNYTAARLADRILTLSENSKKDIAELLRIPRQKITVTFAGVDSRFQVLDPVRCRGNVRKWHGIEGPYLLAPGGLSRNKNVLNLLSAFSEVRKSYPDLSLILTGHGGPDENREVLQGIENLGLQKSVKLTGYIEEEQMPFLYGASAAVVYPSFYEGFGLPAIEAMACGRPLVVADVSALPEVVGDAALRVDPNDPLAISAATKRILEDQKLRDELVQRGLARARVFSWEMTAERVIHVYRDMLSKN
jgi:glycosyltransferase involved in cell wall biosynthesis